VFNPDLTIKKHTQTPIDLNDWLPDDLATAPGGAAMRINFGAFIEI
jgi:hypothetical protein